jgi:hypothetical protein
MTRIVVSIVVVSIVVISKDEDELVFASDTSVCRLFV